MLNRRVLIVDDHEPFRHLVREILEKADHVEVVGEAVDGLEAVRKTVELRPNIVVLDIDLPRLNGIKAAGQIKDLVPDIKVVFLSVESSTEVVEEALKVGAAYVFKVRTAKDLVPAIMAAESDRKFFSNSLPDD